MKKQSCWPLMIWTRELANAWTGGFLETEDRICIRRLWNKKKKPSRCTAPQKLDFFCLTFGVRFKIGLFFIVLKGNQFIAAFDAADGHGNDKVEEGKEEEDANSRQVTSQVTIHHLVAFDHIVDGEKFGKIENGV